MDSDGTFNLRSFWRRPRGAPYFLPLSSCLPPSLSLFTSPSSITHLVWVDGHASGESNHGDAVEACSVGDRRWSEVVIGLWRVTHQDSIDLQRCRRRTLCHSDTGIKTKWEHHSVKNLSLKGTQFRHTAGFLSVFYSFPIVTDNIQPQTHTITFRDSTHTTYTKIHIWKDEKSKFLHRIETVTKKCMKRSRPPVFTTENNAHKTQLLLFS